MEQLNYNELEQVTGGRGSYFNYTVQAGDNLYGIAMRCKTTIQAIMNLNGIDNPNIIHVGQVLRIPC